MESTEQPAAPQPAIVPPDTYVRDPRAVIDAEWRHLRRHRPELAAASAGGTWPLIGLALSGGGIRSAAFALGAMHAMTRFGLLRHVDYLSTVSGGGYSGTALTWTLSTHDRTNVEPQPEQCDQKPDGFPLSGWRQGCLGTATVRPPDLEAWPQRRLDAIRRRGNYLTPAHLPRFRREAADDLDDTADGQPPAQDREALNGLSVLSALAIVLRGAALAIAVYGALAVVGIALMAHVALSWYCADPTAGIFERAGGVLDLAWQLLAERDPRATLANACRRQGVALASLNQGFSVAWVSVWSWIATVAAAFLLLAWLPGAAALLGRRARDSGPAHRRRARYQLRLGRLAAVVIAAALLATLPLAPTALTALALGGGTLAGILRFVGKNVLVARLPQLPTRLVVAAGGALLCYGLLAMIYQIATLHFDVIGWPAGIPLLALAFMALVVGGVSRTNYLTPHRMYRDRLMEAFLPAPTLKEARRCWVMRGDGRTPGVDLLSPDRRMLAHMCGNHPAWDASERYAGPYHIINANIVLTGSPNESRRGRGGDNFILSPLYCGSNATGWRGTVDYATAPGREDSLRRPVITLATAMAISGAAVNPNGWGGDEGPTRNRAIAFLMSILNLRLGYDIPNPARGLFESASGFQPNLLRPGMLRLAGAYADERRGVVELTDGGHFENLGLYELMRRECRLIVCVDAAQDQGFAFSDLSRALERVRVDFGVNVKFLAATPLRSVVLPPATGQATVSSSYAERGFALARIEYPPEHGGQFNEPTGKAARLGLLVYIKSTLLADLPVDLLGYRAADAAFPHQSTADQFFTETQFEAYRELGYQLTKRCLKSATIASLIKCLDAPARAGFEARIRTLAAGAV